MAIQSTPHLAVLNWTASDSFEPGLFIGSEGDDGEHLREPAAGWPWSIYRKTRAVGGTDVVLCQGIQSYADAEILLALCNGYQPPVPYTPLRPGDMAAIYAEENGVSYEQALVACNMD